MLRRLYVMRHGEVSYFGADGQPNDPMTVSLSPEGRAQCESVRDALAGVVIHTVVTSGLRRAVESAEIVVEGRGLIIEALTELEEVRILEGETVAQLSARVAPAWQRLVDDDEAGDVLVVAHAVVNRAILARALDAGTEIYARIEQDYACVNVIDLMRGEPVVRALNLTPYDLAKAGLRAGTAELIARSR